MGWPLSYFGLLGVASSVSNWRTAGAPGMLDHGVDDGEDDISSGYGRGVEEEFIIL